MKRTKIKPVSEKRQGQLVEYRELVVNLRHLCSNKSELSGNSPDWLSGYRLDAHHIDKRNSNRLLDPRNIIMLTRLEHQDIHFHNTYEKKQELLAFIEPIRLRQGFVKE